MWGGGRGARRPAAAGAATTCAGGGGAGGGGRRTTTARGRGVPRAAVNVGFRRCIPGDAATRVLPARSTVVAVELADSAAAPKAATEATASARVRPAGSVEPPSERGFLRRPGSLAEEAACDMSNTLGDQIGVPGRFARIRPEGASSIGSSGPGGEVTPGCPHLAVEVAEVAVVADHDVGDGEPLLPSRLHGHPRAGVRVGHAAPLDEAPQLNVGVDVDDHDDVVAVGQA